MLLIHTLNEIGHIYAASPTPSPAGGGVSIPNPGAAAPPGVSAKASDIVAYVKWGVLIVIVIAAFVGVGAVAGGRVFAHHGASRVGMSMLISAVIAAVLYAGIYAFITATATA